MIQITNLNKKYHEDNGEAYAVNHINLSFENKGMYFILGKSGSGKTTLLNVLCGLDNFDNGIVSIDDQNIESMDKQRADTFRNLKLGLIFQEYNLINELNVFENIAVSLRIQNWDQKTEKDIIERVKKVLSFVDLSGYETRAPWELSTGERQRVAIARAIIKEPKIILADEPAGILDIKTSETIYELLKRLSKKCTVIVVTHNPQTALYYGDYIITLDNGRIIDFMKKKNQVAEMEYNLVLKETLTNDIKMYSRLNKTDAASKLSKLLDITREKVDCELYIEKVTNYENEEEEGTDKYQKTVGAKNREKAVTRTNISAVNMKSKDIKRLIKAIITNKSSRFVLTIILLAGILLLLCMTSFVTCYNRNNALCKYFDEYCPEYLLLESEKNYVDENQNEHQRIIKKGKNYIESLKNINDDEANLGFDEEASIMLYIAKKNYKTQKKVTVLYDTGVLRDHMQMAFGRLPTKPGEIAIADYIAKELSIDTLGVSIYYRSEKLTLVGIVCTDYDSYNLDNKILYNDTDKLLEYNYKYKYNVAVVHKSLLDKIKANNYPIELNSSNFYYGDSEAAYLGSKIKFGNIENYTNMKILCGRMPENDNEVLVSNNFAKLYIKDESWTPDESREYKFIDIQDAKYNSCYDDTLNLYQLFQGSVKIVGVYSTETGTVSKKTANTDVILTNNSYTTIAEPYFWDCFYDGYMAVVNSKNYAGIIDAADKEGLRFQEPSVNGIYVFAKVVDRWSTILYFILIIGFMIVVIMIVNYVNNMLYENKKSVGILWTLGVNSCDIVHIFQWHVISIYTISWMIALAGICGMLIMVNNLYKSYLFENIHNLIYWNHPITVIAITCTYIICILSVYVVVGKLVKQKELKL